LGINERKEGIERISKFPLDFWKKLGINEEITKKNTLKEV